MSESVIFNAAAKLRPEQRSEYLDRVCNGDLDVRHNVESLLNEHDQAVEFLELPAFAREAGPDATSHFQPVTERPGTVIGPYKLMEQIGEGAFGLVFVAEQQQPVRRKVALKITKPGMDTKEVVARFEAERQALALMDHPNIAKVFDAGTTQSGRPYFVMELVKGVPIVEYCDEQRLSNKERLRLFIAVCHAVQHAHSKGVIHRDLKPSNILIAPHDGVPVVKVIDFGIAKAIGQQLSEKTIYTSFARMIGTPLYMSPEQAEINALDVDTRSDVYSLGVLLYELLTGTTPFDRKRMANAAFDELRRIIREEEPVRPSTRLSTLGDTLPMISKQRKSDPAKLPATVKGDLDWIVMKALEKNRERRYETANGLAMDVHRYLQDQPVVARPPSATYRFGKFVRRNRLVVFTTSTIAVGLLLGVGGYAWQAQVANKERLKAAEAELIALQEARKAAAAEQLATEKSQKAAASEQVVQLVLKSFDPETLGDELATSAMLENADNTIAGTYQGSPLGKAHLRAVFAERFRLLGLKVRPEQSSALWDAAVKNLELALKVCRQELGDQHQETLAQISALENLLEFCGYVDKQLEVRRLKCDIFTQRYGADADRTLEALGDLAWTLNWHGDLDEAAALRKRVYESYQLIEGNEHPDTLYALANYADARHACGEQALAKVLRQRFLDKVRGNPDLVSKETLAHAFVAQGEFGDASQLYETSVSVDDLGIEHWLDGQDHALTADTPQLVLHWEHWCPWSQQWIQRMNALVSDYDFDELHVIGVTHDTDSHLADSFVERNSLTIPNAKFDATLLDHMEMHYVPLLFAVRDGEVVWVGPMWQISRAFLDGLSARTSSNAVAASSP